MKGNNRQLQKERMEDRIIKRIDAPASKRYRRPGPLRVTLLELVAYKAALTGRAVPAFMGRA